VDADVARVSGHLDRYFLEFEAGTMKPKACGSRVQELQTQLVALRRRRDLLEGQSTRVTLPPLDVEDVARLMDDFETVFD
ncbi:MAG: hypothetical protein ABIP29_09470, partial [Candidatus Eisenbacteria bacterium]